MQKLYSQLIGMPVFDEYAATSIALVRDIILDPENGNVLAFAIKNEHIIVPIDIERLGSNLVIKERSHIVPMDEVLRVAEVARRNVRIIGARVITQHSKTYLGRVVDYEIDTRAMMLTAIHVAKTFLFFHFSEKIIPHRAIVKINRDTIVVKDARTTAAVKEKTRAPSSAFAA
jgi:sporulation protein YlmC with PRC-barrel domain